ncbi:hypothetical protein GCM10022245_57530 [Streptomyces mayteni]
MIEPIERAASWAVRILLPRSGGRYGHVFHLCGHCLSNTEEPRVVRISASGCKPKRSIVVCPPCASRLSGGRA